MRKLFLFILVIHLFNVNIIKAENSNDLVEADSSILFESDEIINLSIAADFKTLLENRASDEKYLSIVTLNDSGKSIPAKIKTRGHSRRTSDIFDFPPLKIYFDLDETVGTVFENQKKLKIVTQANTKDPLFEKYLLKEYLAYKTLNILTEKSFKVRLAKIRFIDINNAELVDEQYAFFIENKHEMAERNGASIYTEKTHPLGVDKYTLNTVAIFQYMIANTDWSVPHLHNIKLIQTAEGEKPIAIPYDFDWAGLVDADYAVPAPFLKINDIQSRVYRGYYHKKEDLAPVIELFNEKKEEVLELYKNFEPLSKKDRRETIKYLKEFYSDIITKKTIENEFEGTVSSR